ncbi:hypothetical protein HIO71_02870 [Chryseobacterium aquaticum]|uniref:DUF3945 domain-containing protein n=1 Tax=Chryseobacterium aquaticum TaxID=452084 RepID=A0A848MYG8_9FLAO|nr:MULTISPECIES: hypothetical protein [Chryseobacterium]NMR33146.1 hypothetical protein [Chryseobacterium aquaticum]NRQ44923.1 hypothetical protein [Chryseobacterium sp. C-204]
MEDNLTWFDKNIVPRTKAYKNFVKEMENTSPEQFFRDGERIFTDKEKNFMSIHQSRGRAVIIDSNFTLKTIFNSNPDLVIRDTFNNPAELVRFIEKQQLVNKQLILQNNRESTEITVSSESIKQKFLSDLWAQELEKKTDLSSGLTYTQIDEKQAYHYRNYEVEAAKLSLEEVHQIEMTDLEENVDFFLDEGFEENLTPASDLPDDWVWREYDDGSGSLKSPGGYSYYSYDLQTQEYRLPYGSKEWTGMRDFYNEPQTLHDFKIYAERDIKEKAVKNNLSPKLSEEEKNDLLNHKSFNKENEFIQENLQITSNQRKAYSEKMEFETTNGDYSLTNKQLDQIPDVLDGHDLSKNDKYALAFGLLEKPEHGESYEILISGEILKIYLEEDSLPKNRILTINEIKFNNQTPKIMETKKEFDQVQYLKDQMKYLGFGEGDKLHKDLEEGIKSAKQDFEIKTTSDKTLPENKVDFTLKFNKSENGGVFLNSYNATLKNEKDESISHQFYVSKKNTFTAKEAVNLLEGRTVKIEFTNPKTEKLEPAFVKLNFEEPKTEKGNYNFQNFYKNYGIDTAQIIEKSNLIFDKPEWKDNTIKSLEKGNIVKVKFELDDKVVEGKAVLNPQYKNLNLYDSDMNRINTNKPLEGLEQDNKHEKNNVKEQSIKR